MFARVKFVQKKKYLLLIQSFSIEKNDYSKKICNKLFKY